MKRFHTCLFLLLGAINLHASTPCVSNAEPNVETAIKWWEPQRNVWTPLGWKDHLFRFNVLYNGTILVAPMGGYHREFMVPYSKDNMQLTFLASKDGRAQELPAVPTKVYNIDGGRGLQGWDESHEAPILWTEWPHQDGVVIKQEIFAHLQNGKPVDTALEPLYSWVRLSVSYVDPVRPPDKYFVNMQLSRLYTSNIYPFAEDDSVTLNTYPDKAPFATPLEWEQVETPAPHYLIRMNDGRVRAAVLPGASSLVEFKEHKTSGVYNLKIELPAKVGAYADILVPFQPEPLETISEELKLGRTAALKQTEKYWGKKPKTAARIVTPEHYVNEALRRNLQFAELLAERNPDNKTYTFLSGSYGYDALWSTPTSMVSHMFLDLLGYHSVVDKHIDVIRQFQGTVKPPGDAYTTHPGYLATPAFLKTFDWLADHGANLEAASRHALLTGDKEFIEKWTTPTVAACDFLMEYSNKNVSNGIDGLLPPAAATDTSVPSVAVWSLAWNYKGLLSAVKLLQQINHPRADEFAEFAEKFRSRFDEVFREKAAVAPKWKAPNGNMFPILPMNLLQAPAEHIFDDAFLLDGGPLVLPFSGLIPADDPLMTSFADFFRVGPNTKLWGPRSSPIARAILRHEISSCEPCYSWNIVNSAKSGDRERFLEGMYSLMTGAISPQTYINGEHRNAMYGTLFVAPLMAWCIRQSVIDDEEAAGELHLLRLVPSAWVTSSTETVFENMPTIYGPVSLRFQLSSGENSVLNVNFSGKWRSKAPRIILHRPPLETISQIMVNGNQIGNEKQIILSAP